MKLGCIGDDFTGSSDLANTLAKGGMRVVQYTGIPSGPADADVDAGVVALKSRSIDPKDAIAQSLAALEGCDCSEHLHPRLVKSLAVRLLSPLIRAPLIRIVSNWIFTSTIQPWP